MSTEAVPRTQQQSAPVVKHNDAANKSKGASQKGGGAQQQHLPTKVVIRRLPPDLPEPLLWQVIAQWIELSDGPAYDWKAFYAGKIPKTKNKERVLSRAYINFKDSSKVIAFKAGFDGHVFKDSKGNQSQVVIEFAPYRKVPIASKQKDSRENTIEEEPDYLAFLERLNNPTAPPADVASNDPVATTAEPSAATLAKSTPLLEYLRAQKLAAAANKGKAPAKVKAAEGSAKEKEPAGSAKAAGKSGKKGKAAKASSEAGAGPSGNSGPSNRNRGKGGKKANTSGGASQPQSNQPLVVPTILKAPPRETVAAPNAILPPNGPASSRGQPNPIPNGQQGARLPTGPALGNRPPAGPAAARQQPQPSSRQPGPPVLSQPAPGVLALPTGPAETASSSGNDRSRRGRSNFDTSGQRRALGAALNAIGGARGGGGGRGRGPNAAGGAAPSGPTTAATAPKGPTSPFNPNAGAPLPSSTPSGPQSGPSGRGQANDGNRGRGGMPAGAQGRGRGGRQQGPSSSPAPVMQILHAPAGPRAGG